MSKNSKYDDFDAEKLFWLKEHNSGYRYCPRCASGLIEIDLDGHRRLSCASEACSFIYYQNPVPAAGAVVAVKDEILLVKRAHPPRVGDWCIPAGFMEWREHPSETAVREVREETGLDIELTDFFEVYSGTDDPRSNAVLILYLANIVGGVMAAGDDAQDVRYFAFDKLPENIAFEAHMKALADYQKRFRS